MFERYLKLLQENGLRNADVTRATGIPSSTFTEWKRGTYNPKREKIEKIAEFFGVNPDWLAGTSNIIDIAEKKKKGVKIPVLGRVQAGMPVEAIEEILDYEEITEDMAKTGDFFGLIVRGESMEPKFSDGDVVIVRQQSDIESGNIAVVIVNGQDATIKRVKKTDGGLLLQPTNPAFRAIFYTAEEVAELPVEIIGRVVELRAKF